MYLSRSKKKPPVKIKIPSMNEICSIKWMLESYSGRLSVNDIAVNKVAQPCPLIPEPRQFSEAAR